MAAYLGGTDHQFGWARSHDVHFGGHFQWLKPQTCLKNFPEDSHDSHTVTALGCSRLKKSPNNVQDVQTFSQPSNR